MNCIYCNNPAKHTLKNGNPCCSPSHNSCPEVKRKNSETQKGRKRTWTTGGEFKKGNIPANKGKKVGRRKIWDIKYPLEEVMVENSSYSRGKLRKRLIDNNILEYKCQICGIDDQWNGKSMPLILDHINGKNDDHRLENLRFVCSNCDSQLPTYKSRNRST